ncbi:MAG: hypothetical protein CME65_13390 [Halobacteriovoraceae bacterium]|nr:hypothetical protein [Halobacteriovoraceae bacterium]|tara:strand:- start:1892 stop:2587 length:696 start_codon:yes stop_codon:yes gene_type:complete
MKFLSVLFLGLLSLPVYSLNLESGWKKISEKDGIKVYTKSTKDSPIQYLRAKGVISAKVENICAILRSVETAVDWTPNLIERSYVKNISDTEAILYDVSNMPWPVTDREMVLHHKLSVTEDRDALVLDFKSVDNPKAKRDKDYVRAKIEFGQLRFKPVENGKKTEMEMIVLVDPMGSIPVWIVNLLQVSIPYDFLMALNKYAVKTKIKPLPGVLNLITQVKSKHRLVAGEE